MSEVRKSYSIESVKNEFNLLLDNLSILVEQVRPRTRISSTKLGRVKKDLDNLLNLQNEEIAKTIEIATKYNSINQIFSKNVDYNKLDLFKIIEGSTSTETESNEKYNDFFFEFSMASRFLQALQKSNEKVQINLAGDCDIIVDEKLAIECKYIHSQAGIVANVNKADEQVAKRVAKGQASCGFIALDLSNLVPRGKISNFIDFTLSKFLESYTRLETKQPIHRNLLERILSDRNFLKIIGNYFSFEVETILYEELGFSHEMGDRTMAILVQAINTFVIEYEGQVVPIPNRCMTYIINSNLSQKVTDEVEQFIHNLAVGV